MCVCSCLGSVRYAISGVFYFPGALSLPFLARSSRVVLQTSSSRFNNLAAVLFIWKSQTLLLHAGTSEEGGFVRCAYPLPTLTLRRSRFVYRTTSLLVVKEIEVAQHWTRIR